VGGYNSTGSTTAAAPAAADESPEPEWPADHDPSFLTADKAAHHVGIKQRKLAQSHSAHGEEDAPTYEQEMSSSGAAAPLIASSTSKGMTSGLDRRKRKRKTRMIVGLLIAAAVLLFAALLFARSGGAPLVETEPRRLDCGQRVDALVRLNLHEKQRRL